LGFYRAPPAHWPPCRVRGGPRSARSEMSSTPKQRHKFLEMVSQRRYLEVVRELANGADPNGTWRNMLPLRTAVLVGDPDMVALLCDAGADPAQEPFAMVDPKGDDVPPDALQERVVLGKCPRALAEEMAADVANPLHREASAMVSVMADEAEARKRVLALHGRLEAELSVEVREARRNVVLSAMALVLFGLIYWYVLRPMEDNPDGREL